MKLQRMVRELSDDDDDAVVVTCHAIQVETSIKYILPIP